MRAALPNVYASKKKSFEVFWTGRALVPDDPGIEFQPAPVVAHMNKDVRLTLHSFGIRRV